MEQTVRKLETFLFAVDSMFPVPLSEKQDLHEFARKLFEKATLCYSEENGDICSLVAGYTDNVVNNLGYISVVATLPQVQGRGYGSSLVRDFLDIAQKKDLDAVHLYTARENDTAIKMYKKLGFVEWHLENEPRPDDLHLIYYIKDNQE